MPPVFREWLVTLVNDLTRIQIDNSLLIVIVRTIKYTVELHPLRTAPTPIIA